MITKEYAIAYKEVMTILSYVPKSDVDKIPQQKLEFYKSNMDKEYEYKIDETKQFEEQEMSDITKAVLANIFKDYWATPYQKEKIKAKEEYDLKKIEEEKSKKYNSNNIFKDKQVNKIITSINLPTKVKKEKLVKKLVEFIKNIINKR